MSLKEKFKLYARLCNEGADEASKRELEQFFAEEMMQEYGWKQENGQWVQEWVYDPEDKYDAAIADEAYAEYETSGKKSTPIEELWKELDEEKGEEE